MPSSPRSPDAAWAAAGLQARLEAAERLIGELSEGMAVMAGAHRRELEARDVVIAGQAKTIAGQADRIAQLERRLGRDYLLTEHRDVTAAQKTERPLRSVT